MEPVETGEEEAEDQLDGEVEAEGDEAAELDFLAPVDSFYEEVADTPNDKLLRVSQVDLMQQPDEYRTNTAKEELMLEYVRNFET